MNYVADGFTRDELLAIGSRKAGIDVNMSATDINSAIPHAVSQSACQQLNGFSQDELKIIGDRKAPVPAMRPAYINQPELSGNSFVETTLEKLRQFLGVRTQ